MPPARFVARCGSKSHAPARQSEKSCGMPWAMDKDKKSHSAPEPCRHPMDFAIDARLSVRAQPFNLLIRARFQIGNPASFIKWRCNPNLSLLEPCIGMERRMLTPGFE